MAIERSTAEQVQATAVNIQNRNLRLYGLGERGQYLKEGREPFILTCTSWQAQGRFIMFWVNPSDISWSFKLRGVTSPNKGGTISYIWRDNRRGNTFYDEPRVTFTFQTGNCMPVQVFQGGFRRAEYLEGEDVTDTSTIRMPPGLFDLYDFLELMDEPMILSDGSANYRYIYYNSVLFPNITLRGWFVPEQDFSITESKDSPTSTTWSHTFIVRDTVPRYTNPAALAFAFDQAYRPQQGVVDEGIVREGANEVPVTNDTETQASTPQDNLEPDNGDLLFGDSANRDRSNLPDPNAGQSTGWNDPSGAPRQGGFNDMKQDAGIPMYPESKVSPEDTTDPDFIDPFGEQHLKYSNKYGSRY